MNNNEKILGILNRKRPDDASKTERHVHFEIPPTQSFEEYSDPDSQEEEDFEYSQNTIKYLPVDLKNVGDLSKVPKLAGPIFQNAKEASKNFVIPDFLQDSNQNLSLKADQIENFKKIRNKSIEIFFGLSNEFETSLETIYLASLYLDQIICDHSSSIPQSDPKTSNKDLQLFILSIFWIASKFIDRFPPRISKLIGTIASPSSIKESDLIKHELQTLRLLGFQLNYSSPRFFVRRFLEIIQASQQIGETITFFCDLSLFDPIFRSYPPYVIAYASVLVGLYSNHLQNNFLIFQLKESFPIEEMDQVLNCAQKLVAFAIDYFENQTFLIERYTNPPFSSAIAKISEILPHIHFQ